MKQLLTLIAVVALLIPAFAIADDDTAIKKPAVPEAVSKAFEKSYPQDTVTEYSKKVVNGQTCYEIETKAGGLERDLIYLSDGTLLQIEEDMTVKLLPAVIVKSVEEAFPEGEIDEADKITRGETTEYQLIVETSEIEYELLLSSDGKILSSSQSAEDEDEPADVDENDEEDDN